MDGCYTGVAQLDQSPSVVARDFLYKCLRAHMFHVVQNLLISTVGRVVLRLASLSAFSLPAMPM